MNPSDATSLADSTRSLGNPQVDVLMAAYNAAWSLPETLVSIQAQTVRDIRIVVVDDGSTDGTAQILKQAAEQDPRILVITQSNGGIVSALNAGLAHCTAPFIARHDADDLSEPDRLERQLHYLDENPDCIALSGPARQIDERGADLGTITRVRDPKRADPFEVPAREPYLLQPMLMVRRSAIMGAGGYRPLLVAEDSDLYWRLHSTGRLHNMDHVLGSYRMHSDSISSQSIVAGRQAALCSQLAAISAQRRQKGKTPTQDIRFTVELLHAIKRGRSVKELFEIGREQVEQEEEAWLAGAMAAKIIEFCFYRPFELSVEDCQFIRWAMPRARRFLTAENAAFLREAIVGTVVRLALKRFWKEALLLSWPKLVPIVLPRIVFRAVLSNRVRNTIKRLSRRGASVPAR